MTSERDQIIRKRNRLKAQYGRLYAEVEQILFRYDPVDIAFVGYDEVADNPDEYAPEVETILPRLETAKSAEDVTEIVYEEFVRWFGLEEPDDDDVAKNEDLNDEDLVGPKSAYAALSVEIWDALLRFRATSATP